MAWIGVDLDGTLAEYHEWSMRIGKPIPLMAERVKAWLAQGIEVRIVTARVGRPEPGRVLDTPEKIEEIRKTIENWCERHLGQRLKVTNEKDFGMLELWDDRAIQVESNTGRVLAPMKESEQVEAVTRATIRADRASAPSDNRNHWVRDWLIPFMRQEGLEIVSRRKGGTS